MEVDQSRARKYETSKSHLATTMEQDKDAHGVRFVRGNEVRQCKRKEPTFWVYRIETHRFAFNFRVQHFAIKHGYLGKMGQN